MSKKVQFTRRANGEGSVYQIKDGRFGAAISLGKDEKGKRFLFASLFSAASDMKQARRSKKPSTK